MKKLFIFGFIFILMLSLVTAQPWTEPQSLDTKLTLETVKIQEHLKDTPFYLHYHIYFTESGMLVNSSLLSCNYHLYSENVNWQHLDIGNLTSYGAGVFTKINETKFNETGKYSILTWCKCSDCEPPYNDVGGFTQYNFEVKADTIFNFNSITLYFVIGIILFLLIISFATKQAMFGLFAGLIMLLMSLYLISTLMIIGVILTIVSIMIILLFLFNL